MSRINTAFESFKARKILIFLHLSFFFITILQSYSYMKSAAAAFSCFVYHTGCNQQLNLYFFEAEKIMVTLRKKSEQWLTSQGINIYQN